MTSIDKAAIDGLAANFQGELIQPNEGGVTPLPAMPCATTASSSTCR